MARGERDETRAACDIYAAEYYHRVRAFKWIFARSRRQLGFVFETTGVNGLEGVNEPNCVSKISSLIFFKIFCYIDEELELCSFYIILLYKCVNFVFYKLPILI